MKTPLQKQGQGIQHNRSHSKSGGWFLWVGLAVGVLLVFTLVNGASVAQGADFCMMTSQQALDSCQAGAQSNYSLALGKCYNLAKSSKQKACRKQALADQQDALQTCQDQYDAWQAVCAQLGPAPYDPMVDPKNFADPKNMNKPFPIDNPYFPLKPGTTFIYESSTEQDEVFVTHNTKDILGVTCTEVHDTVTEDGELTEDTLDWYAQDKDGNVWYFGENSQQLEGGRVVSVEGSWTAGVDGAKPGIIMEANPAVGDFYRQEFALGTAEDVGEVLSLNESVVVPYGSFNNCLKTADTSPLEPDVMEDKFYCQGIGDVLEEDLTSGEKLELKQILP
jgi:hypothetical protein